MPANHVLSPTCNVPPKPQSVDRSVVPFEEQGTGVGQRTRIEGAHSEEVQPERHARGGVPPWCEPAVGSTAPVLVAVHATPSNPIFA